MTVSPDLQEECLLWSIEKGSLAKALKDGFCGAIMEVVLNTSWESLQECKEYIDTHGKTIGK